MKISASIFAVEKDFIAYANRLKYSGVHSLHLDYLEGCNAPIKLEDLAEFSLEVELPLDVHLIQSSLTERDIYYLNKALVKYLTVQYENLVDKKELDMLNEFNGICGIGITSRTPLNIIEELKDKIQYVMVMCSEPGVSASKFDESNIDRIKHIRKQYPNLPIHVDGGIENINGITMKELKVDLVVSGSYIARAKNLYENVFRLKYANDCSLKVSQIMIEKPSLPIVSEEESFINIISQINKYKMGLVFVVNANNRFKGVISDGDIRRAFITYNKEIFDKKAGEIMNDAPFYVNGEMTVIEMINKIANAQKGVLVIPVLKDNENLAGAIDLNS